MRGYHPQPPYGSLDDNNRAYDKKQYEYSTVLNDEKYGYVVINQNKKHRTLMVAWAIVVMVASYFVISNSTNPLTTFQTSNVDSNILPIESPEDWIKELPSSESIKNFLHSYASEPHLAGSQNDRHLAEWTRDLFIEFGIENTAIETYYPVLNYPKTRQLSLVNGTTVLYDALLKEDDQNTTPTFHGYSGNGNVTAPVIYVNYGTLDDFQLLVDNKIKVRGNIALVRSGVVSRGQKIRAAEAYGCVGVLIYNDPSDLPSETFGLWQSSSVERGTAHYFITPGDPTTPGYAANTENVTRIALEDSETVPHIPSLPISWKDAAPFLNATYKLGLQIPEWKGDLFNIDYYTGPSELEVNLININDNQVRPIWNVIGRIDGTEEPDHVVLLGNHRDAWSYGAIHPASGSASLLELVRVFGKLLESGWRPRRTIVFASWDAKEYGAVGSTEWVEDHKEWLGDAAVAYINVDTAVSGTKFNAEASPLLYRLLYEVTDSIIDPKTSLTVLEAWSTNHLQNYFEHLTESEDEKLSILKKHKHKYRKHHREDIDLSLIKPLSGASDHVAFFHHAGVSSLTFGFHGDYDVFHTSEDSIELIENYVDPTFEYHQTLVKIWGLLAYRLSEDIVLPIYPLDYINQLSAYVSHLESIYNPEPTEPENPEDPDDPDQCLANIAKKHKHKHKHKHKKHDSDEEPEEPAPEEPPKDEDVFLPNLSSALKDLEEESIDIEHKTTKVYKKLAHSKVSNKVWKRVNKINHRISQFERAFVNLAELEAQQWYRHIVYAPADWAGNEGQVLPDLQQALASGNQDNILYAEKQLVASLEVAKLILKGDYEDLPEDDLSEST